MVTECKTLFQGPLGVDPPAARQPISTYLWAKMAISKFSEEDQVE